MRRLLSYVGFLLLLCGCGRGVSDPGGGASGPSAAQPAGAPGTPPAVRLVKTSENLLKPDRFDPCDKGFERQQDTFVCDNGAETNVVRGASQYLRLNQAKPEPFYVRAYSKAEGVTGSANSDYALYLDIRYDPGKIGSTQTAAFSVGSHDWELREIYFMPERPIYDVSCRLLFRKHGGKAWFKGGELYTVQAPEGSARVATNGPRPVQLVSESVSQAATSSGTRLIKTSDNLLTPGGFASPEGFQREGDALVCDNKDNKVRRVASQVVTLNQKTPEPVFARAYSKAEGVAGKTDREYSLHLDVHYTDGTALFSQKAWFETGTHDWQLGEVYVMPAKPIRVVGVHFVFGSHAGKASFKGVELYTVKAPEGGASVATNGPRPVELVDGPGSRADVSTSTRLVKTSENLFRPDGYTPYGDGGVEKDGDLFVCNNGSDANVARGVSHGIDLNQTRPEPFFVRAYSKAEGVTGSPNDHYALYLDIRYEAGKLGGFQSAPFTVGTHDWELREVYVMPEGPVHDVSCHLLFRKHGGKVWFKGAEFFTVEAPSGGVRVATNGPQPVELVDSPTLAAAKRAPPVTKLVKASENLLSPYAFDPMGQGFERQRETFFCDNGDDAKAYRGVEQSVELRQTKPEPLFAVGYSKAEGVKGLVNQEYSVFLDVQHTDSSFTHWRFSAFNVGTHDWQRREVYYMPQKPISVVWYHVVFRNHSGKAWFRLPELYKVRPPEGNAQVALNRPEPVTLVDSDFSELPALPASVTAPGKPAIAVAVLDFVDKGPSVELASLRTALAEMLAGDLSQYEGLRVVERVRVEQLLSERNLQQGLTDQAATAQVAKALAADYLVEGSFVGKATAVTVEVSLSKTGEGKPIAQWKERVPLAKLAETEQQLVAKIVSGMGMSQPKRRSAPKSQPGPSPLVAVLAFKNLSPSTRLTAMEGGFADILQDNLSAVKDVRLVEREKLRTVLSEQKLSLSGLADAATAIRVGRLLGAQRLIYGSFVELGEDLRLDVRLADSRTGAVLAAETATGKSSDFATLLEGLAVRLAADLAVEPDPDTAGRVKAATPTRSIEAAIHLSDGDKAFAQGQYEAAAKAYERVLLADPKNVTVGMRRTKAWYLAKDFRRTVDAGEQTMAAGFSVNSLSPGDTFWSPRAQFLDQLVTSYGALRNDEGSLGLLRRIVEECPSAAVVSWARKCLAYRAMRDPDGVGEGEALLKDAVQAARKKNNAREYSDALRALFDYYQRAAQMAPRARPGEADREDDPGYQRQLAERRAQWAKAAEDILELALKAAEARRDDCWSGWAYIALNRARNMDTPQARYEMLNRILHGFSWVPSIPWKVHVELGATCMELKRWDEAMKSHRYLLEHPQTGGLVAAPDLFDIAHQRADSGMDQQVRSLFYIGQIQQVHLKQPEEAERKYQDLVNRFGLVHNGGRPISAALHEMDKKPAIPAKVALVWGGRETAQKAWDELLGPMGFRTHVVGRYSLSEAHLAPYSLVVLARPGMIAYAPDDILALRSYVATGGSLLVVVSPGWELSQPANQNSLLWLFGVQADQETEIRARSTRIVPHPITESITSAMAKNAVNLKVPQGTGLIQAGDRTVLAAMPYRRGRVVVASFGQWFLPTFSIETTYRWPGHRTSQLPQNNVPLETGQQRQLPLLMNVVRWLTEPRLDDEELDDRRKPFVEALAASMRVQFGVVPRETLKDPLKKLVAEAEAGIWKEEALWTAGEASLRWAFLGRGDALQYSLYDYWSKDGPPYPMPEYYQRLIDEFPQSPLRPLAQWRLADCRRRKAIADRFKELQRSTYADQGESIPLFQKVDAPKGSYPWAWARLWIGSIHAANGRHGEAAQFFREVAEAMPAGPEKSMALVNVGYMLEFDKGRWEEAIRYHKAAKDAPDNSWQRLYSNGWGPLSVGEWPNTTHDMADSGLARLQRAAKK
jgi:TolB-like protein